MVVFCAYLPPIAVVDRVLEGHDSGMGGDAGGSEGGPLHVEVPVVVESLSIGGSELSESDSESESSVELAGGMVS